LNRRRSAILAVALSLGLGLGACGDDPSPSANDDDSGDSGASTTEGFTVTVGSDGIEVPDEVTGGVVTVKLEADDEDAEVNFTKVAAGTTEDQFKQEIVKVVTGGPMPSFLQATTGVLSQAGGGGAEETIVLPEGDYIAWAIPEAPEEQGGEDGGGPGETTETSAAAGETARGQEAEEGGAAEGPAGPPPEAVLTAAFKVTPGEAADLPQLDGNTITARDYSFDVKLTAGAHRFVFKNAGPEQLHHVVLFSFGDIEPATVEENLPAFFEAGEGSPPPAAFKDLDMEKLEAGDGPVLSPELGATATLARKLESGTYAAICFISDRTGGPPHAIGKGMRTVFTVE
jgi:hypothetical protein